MKMNKSYVLLSVIFACTAITVFGEKESSRDRNGRGEYGRSESKKRSGLKSDSDSRRQKKEYGESAASAGRMPAVTPTEEGQIANASGVESAGEPTATSYVVGANSNVTQSYGN